ncbi:PQQ-binding-like beta-propeller repeat protein [Planctomicrobium piriforme]|uniref:Pyrrolo-quinoline quinone repeat domain-containing protein n=1 Tax=Planctomicrobium piriforme TaxID=1576369 RepID=A0A1I3LLV0_9PLAN|nr:PQQ-binding-like beta-propeller repeat protein [Planctomicrobium piriforme]SFI85769.1 hypothetical protein SAMN05421753_1133 [Planctomicrobium piriforme]
MRFASLVRSAAVLGLTIAFQPSGLCRADDWLRFRGPNGSGVSTDTESIPAKWSATENLKWKTALPGPGSSSPIIVGQKIFVTCWSGYGADRNNPGDLANLRRHLVCLDLKSGQILWDQSIAAVQPEERYGGMFAENGYASHTPTSDGKHVYVYYGKSGALAYDLDGKQLWQKVVGSESDPRGWGSASSPILYKNLVIVPATAECEGLVALNKETGAEVWRQEARGFAGTWGTPILITTGDRTDLVMAIPGEVWAFNPDTGKLRWYCQTGESDSYCASAIEDHGVVYALENRGGQTTALRAGGDGDVTSSAIVWHGRDNARITTPVVVDGKIYLFSGGIATCLDAKTGERIYQSRLGGTARPRPEMADRGPGGGNGPGPGAGNSPPGGGPGAPGGRGGRGGGGGRGGQDYSSPIVADGKVIFISRSGEAHVVQPGDKFEELAVNTVTADQEDFSATPAVSDGNLLIRSSKNLYCISKQ